MRFHESFAQGGCPRLKSPVLVFLSAQLHFVIQSAQIVWHLHTSAYWVLGRCPARLFGRVENGRIAEWHWSAGTTLGREGGILEAWVTRQRQSRTPQVCHFGKHGRVEVKVVGIASLCGGDP